MRTLALMFLVSLALASAGNTPRPHWARPEVDTRKVQAVKVLHEKMQQLFSNAVATFKEAPRVHKFEAQDASSCAAALAAGASDSCFTDFTNLLAYGANAQYTTQQKLAQVTTYCTNCRQKISDVVANISTECQGVPFTTSLRNHLRTIKRLVDVPCVMIGSTYCMPQMWSMMREWQAIGTSTPSSATLANVCSPCARKALLFYLQFMTASEVAVASTAFDMLCMRDSGRWCYLEFKAYSTMGSNLNFNTLCRTSCLARMFRKIMLVVPMPDSTQRTMAALFANFCVRNPSGTLCLTVMQNQLDALGAPPTACETAMNQLTNNTAGTLACPATCPAFFQSYASKMGCCLDTLLTYLNIANPDKSNWIVRWARTQCGVTFSGPCRAAKKVKVKLVIRTIKAAWLNAVPARKDALIAAIKKDLAARAGVTEDDVIVTLTIGGVGTSAAAPTLQAAADGVTADAEIQVSSSSEADAVQSDLQTDLAAGAVPLPSVEEAVPPDGRTDPTATLTPDTSASTIKTEGAGVMLRAGMLPMLLALLLVALRMH